MRTSRLILTFAFIVGLSIMVRQPMEANQGGTSTAQFLKIGQGARAEGLGGAYTAIADDARAINWNPAGLAQVTRKQVTFDHLKYIEDINAESLAGVLPLNDINGSLGVAITYLDMGTIERRDASNAAVSGDADVNASAATLSWGQAIGERLALGGGVKFIKQKLAEESGSGIAGDLGILFFLLPDRLSLGASVLNLGPQLKTGSTAEDLPQTFRGGAAYHAIPGALVFDVDVEKERDTDTVFHGGGEYIYQHAFIARLGYQDNKEANGGLSAGLGFLWHPRSETKAFPYGAKEPGLEPDQGLEIRFDYAYVDFGDFDATHRIGVLVSF